MSCRKYICWLYPWLIATHLTGSSESICDQVENKIQSFQRFQHSLESSLGGLDDQQLLQPIQEAQAVVNRLHKEIVEQSTSSCETIVAIRNASTNQERQELLKKAQEIRQSVDAHIPVANEAMNRVVLNHRQIKQAVVDIKEQQGLFEEFRAQVKACQEEQLSRLDDIGRQLGILRSGLERSLAESQASLLHIENSLEEIEQRREVVRVCEELAHREVIR